MSSVLTGSAFLAGTFTRRNCGAGMDSRVGAVGAGGAVGFSRKAKPDYIDAMSRVTSHDVDAWLAEIEAKLGWMRNWPGEIVARLGPLEQRVRPFRERLGLDH